MHDINIKVTETGCQQSPLLIGYQGENEVTRVIVDYSAWTEEFGTGSLALEVMRSGDEIPYLAPLTIADGKAVWLVSNVDTGAEGVGAAGFVYTVGDQIKKSAVFRFFVGRDIGGDPGERPDPYEGLIARIERLAAQTEENAVAAAESATDAAGSATTATQQAQAAATERAAAETAQQAAETAKTAAETAQTAAEAARDAAASSATDAAGSATTATQQAQAAATARAAAETAQQAAETAKDAAETAQQAAETARDAAASSATGAAGSATTAAQQAQAAATARAAAEAAQQAAETAKGAAETAQQAAEASQQAIENMTVSAETIDASSPTVEKQKDEQTGAVNLNFGFPKNQATTSTTIGPAPIATIDASAADMLLKGLTVDIEPVQAAGTPSPENPLPITGWTGCNVTRAGKNLIDPTTIAQGTIGSAGAGDAPNRCHTAWDSPIPVKAGTTYIVSGNSTFGVFNSYIGVYADKITTVRLSNSGWIRSGSSYTIPEGAAYARITLRVEGNLDVTPSNFSDVQMEIGTSATAFGPFVANDTYPITFPASAGTVYGGTLTINADGSGELVVTHRLMYLDGTSNGRKFAAKGASNNYFFILNSKELIRENAWVPVSALAENNIMCNCAVLMDEQSYDESKFGFGMYHATSGTYTGMQVRMIFPAASGVTDIESANAFVKNLYDNNTPIVYTSMLATPILYALTAEQITTLLGTNNIWADCGDVAVTYGAYLETIKAHAERLGDSILSAIAPLETTYTASRAYAVGEFLFVGTRFFKVTQAIAEGGTITPETNVEETTVAEQLIALAAG